MGMSASVSSFQQTGIWLRHKHISMGLAQAGPSYHRGTVALDTCAMQ